MIAADYIPSLTTALQNLQGVQLDALKRLVLNCRTRHGVLWIAGNGGSYAIAQHWAADLTKAGGMQAQQLGANAALLTALANDVRFGEVFAFELGRFSTVADALILLSVSGVSANVLVAWREATQRRVPVALVTSEIHAPPPVDVLVQVPTADYGVAEDCMSALGHWLVASLKEA